jgi:hypothetical protein
LSRDSFSGTSGAGAGIVDVGEAEQEPAGSCDVGCQVVWVWGCWCNADIKVFPVAAGVGDDLWPCLPVWPVAVRVVGRVPLRKVESALLQSVR